MKNLNRNQIIDWLKEIGWEIHKDEVGDKFCVYRLGDGLVLEAGLGFRKYGELLEVYMSPSITTEYFGRVSAEIFGRADINGLEPIVVNFNAAKELVQKEYTQQDIKKLSDSVFDWAYRQDVNAGLIRYSELPTDCAGAMPLRHLAALVVLGKIDKLRSYLASFESGNRLGFANYVTEDMIRRAIGVHKKQ